MTGAILLLSLFVSVEDAARRLEQGAVVLDARPAADFRRGHMPGAQPIDWQDFRDGAGRTGRLDDDDAALGRRLAALGVRADRPVVVVGASGSGFGEEGRIAWMLTYLGHPKVAILDGGFAGWQTAGRPVATGPADRPTPGAFQPKRDRAARAELEEVRRAVAEKRAVVIDVRTKEEWEGARLYWEARVGHLPGARHLDWRQLIDGAGRVLAPEQLRAQLARLGVGPDQQIITYCTAGVRSAFAWAALRAAGFGAVRNYDGSFWEWARHQELPVEVGGPPAPPSSPSPPGR